MKRLLILCLAALLLCACSAVPEEGLPGELRYRELPYASPEEAVEAYVRGVAENDLSLALSACALTTWAEAYDIQAYVDRTGVYMPASMPAPGGGELFDEANAAAQLGKLAGQTKIFALCLTIGDDEEFYSAIDGYAMLESGQLARWVERADPAKLESLAVVECFAPVFEEDLLERANEQTRARTGADEAADRVVVLDLDGQRYVCAFMLLRYGEEWKIESHGSNLSGISAAGLAIPLDADTAALLDSLRAAG